MEPTFEIINETTKQEYKVTMDDAIVTGNIERQQGSVISINGTLSLRPRKVLRATTSVTSTAA